MPPRGVRYALACRDVTNTSRRLKSERSLFVTSRQAKAYRTPRGRHRLHSGSKRRWNECLIEAERRWKLRVRWAHAGAHPKIDCSDCRQDLRTGEVTVANTSCVGLEKKVFSTLRSNQFRISRLICDRQQRVDDRMHI